MTDPLLASWRNRVPNTAGICPLCGARTTYVGYSLIRSISATKATSYRCAGRYNGTAPRVTHLIFVTTDEPIEEAS
jgi:hypothetical protein